MCNNNNIVSDSEFSPTDLQNQLKNRLDKSLIKNIIYLRKLFSNSADFITKEINLCGHDILIIYCEGMVNLQLLEPLIITPLYKFNSKNSAPNDLVKWIENNIFLTTGKNILFTYNEIFTSIMSGSIVMLINGSTTALSAEITDFKSRAISDSLNEVDIRSSREALTEVLKTNLTMIRRRIKSPALKFDNLIIGEKSQTTVTLVYLTDVVNCKLIQSIKHKLSKIKIDILLDSSYLIAFLTKHKYSIFPEIGFSERPDILCGKIAEGRVAILVDNCPHAIFLPHLFVENFQTMDDYTTQPIFASFTRMLRYLAFFISILLPGIYVTISAFHPEMFPKTLLYNVASAQETTPFPIMVEALLIHIAYELMQEAGLRLPRQIGNAISIVGALIIGEAAVSSHIIGAPMIIIVALNAITSFIMTSVYQSVCILKFIFIILGGLGGLYGITLGLCVLLINMTSVNSFKVPYMAPITPFNIKAMRDTFIRRNWKYLSKKTMKVQNLPGTKKYVEK